MICEWRAPLLRNSLCVVGKIECIYISKSIEHIPLNDGTDYMDIRDGYKNAVLQ